MSDQKMESKVFFFQFHALIDVKKIKKNTALFVREAYYEGVYILEFLRFFSFSPFIFELQNFEF